MNTIKVRPMLVETKEYAKTGDLVDVFGSLIITDVDMGHHYKQQLILISLEDDKIEVGDLFLADDRDNVMNDPIYSIQKCKEIKNEWIFGNDLDLGYNPDWSEKVIAQQSQLSPELIQQLVDEYNNGGMKDFEILWQEDWCRETIMCMEGNGDNPNNFPYKPQPKLTNGFVTVVEKKSDNFISFLKERIDKASSIETKAAYTITLEQYKKRILYTEEEIFSLGDRYEEYCINCFGNLPKSFSEWFNQNKKK